MAINIYRSADCTSFVTQVDAAELAAGFTVHVAADSTTTFTAHSLDEAGNLTACSAPISYVEDSTTPAAPVVGGTAPLGPSTDDHPEVIGFAEPGSTVRIYSTPDCSGAALATGIPSAFASPGLTVAVPANATTQLRATATDSVGHSSPCSDPVAYTEESLAPATRIDLMKILQRKRTVKIAFHADDPSPGTLPLTYQCRLDKKPFQACRNPKTYRRLKVGVHTIQIRAFDAAGNVDLTPAKRRFRIRRPA